MARRTRFSAHEILVLVVGVTLAITFAVIVCGIMYGLIFVTQPMKSQAPNDKAFIDSVLVPIVLFLSGSLAGVLAANGLGKKKPEDNQNGTNL
jgi:hypothetical protein